MSEDMPLQEETVNTPERHHTVILIVGGMMLIALALAEVTASLMTDFTQHFSSKFLKQEADEPARTDSLTPGSINTDASLRSDPLAPYLIKVDEALAQHDVGIAERAWNEAYVIALRSRRWEGLVDVGHAALRIWQAAGSRDTFQGKARESYLVALFLARQQQSVNGALSVAEAFADLGDQEVATQCLSMAERLAATSRDRQAGEQVSALRERLAVRPRAPEARNSF